MRRCSIESRESPVGSSLLSARSTPASAESRQWTIGSTHALAGPIRFRTESKLCSERIAACADQITPCVNQIDSRAPRIGP
ncbi:MAG: hypothetical protein DMF61_11895 [Blastocatellia bacterium AA13]|nr:MAG: hypothetical protein DMF61_11895 [Blastocatellia bacterium AA13]